MSHSRTICLDFDGVLHGYSQGWQGGIVYDVPVPGAVYACRKLAEQFDLIVCTARDNLDDVRIWLAFWEFPEMPVVREKPPAILYIDDRGMRFTEWPDALAWIAKFLGGAG